MEIANIRMVISQPLVRKAPSEWDCTIEQLDKLVAHTQERAYHALQVWKHEKPEAYYHHQRPGEKQCQYCSAKVDCQKYKETVAETVFMDKTALDGMPCEETDAKLVPYIPTTPEMLASYYLRVPMIEAWCKSVAAAVYEGVKNGTIGEKHGLKMVAGRAGKRKWTDEAAVEGMLKSMKLRQDEMYSFSLITPPQAEKLLAENPRKWNKLQAYIMQPDTAPSIVHISDKRPAIVQALQGMEVVEEATPAATATAPAPADGDDLC